MLHRLNQHLLNLCARVTSGDRLIPAVDGLRFLAIALVVVYHIEGFVRIRVTGRDDPGLDQQLMKTELHQWFSLGYVGVPLFFMISGFILSLPFARHYLAGHRKPSIKSYFLRRLTRLEPPMIFFLLGSTILFGFSYSTLASLFYSHLFFFGTGNGVLWSLEVEAQFYLLAPLLAVVFALRSVALRTGVIVLVMIVFALAQHWNTTSSFNNHWTLLSYLHFFLVGFLCAASFVTHPPGENGSLFWDACGLLGLVAATIALRWFITAKPAVGSVVPHLVLPACGFLLFSSALRGSILRRIASIPWVYTLGGMCYTCYLWHMFVIAAVGKVAIRVIPRFESHLANLLLYLPVMTLAVIVVTIVFFVLIEKPAMRRDWPQALWRRLTGAATRASNGQT
jgi:peptidoglycan/LPS O-acetylase OafA/YrhL